MLRAVRVFRRPVPLPSATDTLSSAISALKVVKTAADIANSTILGNVVSALLICVETAKDARTNKEDADELVARIVRLVLPTINWIHDMNFPQTPVAESLLKDLKDLIPIFEQVTSAMRKITQRNLVFRAVLSLADKENIQQQRRILDNRLQDFHAYRVIEQEEIELLEEVPFPKRALLDLLVEKRINRVSRAQFGADKRLSRVLQYKQDLSEKEFLAQIHRYRSLFHANIAQFRGASNGGHASPTRFIVVDDHPYTIREVLGPDNPCALSVQERVRLALQAAADIYLVCQYLVQNKILFKFNNKPDYTQLRFDATLSKAVFQLPVLGGSGGIVTY
ncbi:hypothetical protein PLICRDRAFT_51335 [Plicaturopsis crispa FD-325 SS-3]|nr:hypothetical protein PLICRDRAFT_51335 [Plicaturopsis crispa FD-325 SS-3]